MIQAKRIATTIVRSSLRTTTSSVTNKKAAAVANLISAFSSSVSSSSPSRQFSSRRIIHGAFIHHAAIPSTRHQRRFFSASSTGSTTTATTAAHTDLAAATSDATSQAAVTAVLPAPTQPITSISRPLQMVTGSEPHSIITETGAVVTHFDNMWHIQQLMDALEFLHTSVHLPWWGSIAALTVIFRTVVLPLNISLIRNSARLNLIRKDVEHLGERIKNGETEEERNAAAQALTALFKQHRVSPFANIISPLVMAPMFLSVFLAVERTVLSNPTCASGGLLWFHNLSIADVTFTLPFLSALTWIITIEIGAAEARTPFMNGVINVTRFLAAAMVPVTQFLPSGVFVYWVTSNLFTLGQMLTLRNEKVRRLLDIPPLKKLNTKPTSSGNDDKN